MSFNSRTQLTLASRGEFRKEGIICAEGQGSNDADMFLEEEEDNRAMEREVGAFVVAVSR